MWDRRAHKKIPIIWANNTNTPKKGPGGKQASGEIFLDELTFFCKLFVYLDSVHPLKYTCLVSKKDSGMSDLFYLRVFVEANANLLVLLCNNNSLGKNRNHDHY